MDKDIILITGMFRSGTTLLSTILNAHSGICSAADSYLPILKEFRNQMARSLPLAETHDEYAPLDDYYFYSRKNLLMKTIQNGSFQTKTTGLNFEQLRKDIADYSEEYSPRVIPYLNEITGKTYREVFENAFRVIFKAYGNGDTETISLKLVWTDEFISHFLNAFPNLKVINIIRDPRAVCASRNILSEKYPWLFLTRQWRKQATFSWLNCIRDSELKNRTLLIRYEDLVADPQETIREICKFMEVGFEELMIKPEQYIGGNGKPWQQNSSYYESEKGLRSFNTESIDKWKGVLSAEEIQFIEHVCFLEMKLFGYDFLYASQPGIPLNLVFNPLAIEPENLAPWIKKYSQTKPDEIIREVGLESLRFSALTYENVSAEMKDLLYLSADIYDEFRKLAGNV